MTIAVEWDVKPQNKQIAVKLFNLKLKLALLHSEWPKLLRAKSQVNP